MNRFYEPAALMALAPTAAPGSGAVIIEVISSRETSSPGNESFSYFFFHDETSSGVIAAKSPI